MFGGARIGLHSTAVETFCEHVITPLSSFWIISAVSVSSNIWLIQLLRLQATLSACAKLIEPAVTFAIEVANRLAAESGAEV